MVGPELRGVFVPHVTPLDASGDIDVRSLESLIQRIGSVDGLGGLVSCARIGEGPVLSWDEQLRVYERVAEAKPGDVPHVATVGAGSTGEAIEKVRQVSAAGADAAMIIPPLLFAWGQSEPEMKYRFFEDLDAETDVPLVLFQVPVSSYWYDADTVARIASLDGVAAIKEASFNVQLFTAVVQTLKAEGRDISILSGNDRFLAQSFMLGIDGALVGVANLLTERWVEMYTHAANNRYSEALGLQEELLEIKDLTFKQPIVEATARIKYCLAEQGVIANDAVRRPQLGLSADAKAELRDALSDNSLLSVDQ
jgi:4-hydroxy-tetrahydrodipicolinate synthase